MAAAAPIAAIASLASIGLSSYASVEKGQGQQAADNFQAAQAENAAKFGRLNADLTDTTMSERLNTTIGNIDAIRAAGNVDPNSPTTGAIEDWNRMLSDRQRTAAVVTAKSQADTEDASAAYLRKAGSFALQQSYLQAAAGVAGGAAKGFSKGGGFNLGGG
jgi:hypothetical protein